MQPEIVVQPVVTENEVTIGGDDFTVKIRSSATLGEVVTHAQRLYREGKVQETRTPKLGFAPPLPPAGPNGHHGPAFVQPASASLPSPASNA